MKLNKLGAEIYPNVNGLGRTTHLAIAAHQDDVEFMAYHGIAACYKCEGKAFSAVVVTNGGGSPRAGEFADFSDSDMIEVRKSEQKAAADMGEYAALGLLMYPSFEVKDGANTNTVDDIFNILSACRPEVVYTHNLADKHDTHVAPALRTIAAIRRLPREQRPARVYGCEVWRDLDWLEDTSKVLLDVSENQELAEGIMQVFKSQIVGGKRYDKAVIGRRVANATFFADHEVDVYTHLTYAMDLTPLVENDSLDVAEFLQGHLDAFVRSVRSKVDGLI